VSLDDAGFGREALQAARWAAKWRRLEGEALVIAEAVRDPEAQRHVLSIAKVYKRLADRANERSERKD
jgi:hypothetical protein